MYTSVIDWTFYWFPSLITQAECNKIVRIVYQPQTQKVRILQTFLVFFHYLEWVITPSKSVEN